MLIPARKRPRAAASIPLLLVLGFLLVAGRSAAATPGAIDQYTEPPPSGPGGSNTDLNAGGGTSGQTDRSGGGGTSAAQTTPAPVSAPAPAANEPPSNGAVIGASADRVAPAQTESEAKGSFASAGPSSYGPPQQARLVSASKDDGGYPLTSFVVLVLILSAVAVALRFALPAIRRLRTGER